MSTKIESLELEIKSNSTKAAKGIDALVESLKALKAATQGGLGLGSVTKEVEPLNNAVKSLRTNTEKLSNAQKNVGKSSLNLGVKLAATYLALKKIGKTIKNFVTESAEYTENVNLFTVSMGEYASEAKAYAETVSEAMGIDTSDWMRAQGVFMTISTGFGIAGDRAATMSKNLTQLGYDISSFYNISVEDAMDKLKSGLAGELEPLRAIGYDLSQAKLEATALALGIDKSVSSMTQAEKAQLRYYAIMTQVTQVQGDMARTLEDPANQMRVFKAQIGMAGREIGNIFIPALNAILPYAIAVLKVIRALAGTIASLFGYEAPELDESTSKVVENTDAVQDNLEGAKEEAKKLKSYMLGFDELNVINPNTESEVDTSGAFDFDLPEYDFMAGLVESKVNTIVQEMKEWLGITEDIDSWSELLDTRFGNILTTVMLIGAELLVWKVSKTFMASITALQALLKNPTYSIVIGAMLIITGIKISIDGMKDAVKNGLDGFNFGEIVGGSLLTISGAIVLGAALAVWIDKVFTDSKLALAIVKAGIHLGTKTVAGTGAALGAAFTAIIAGIPMYIIGIYDACKEGLDWLNGTLISLGATLAGAGIGFLIGGPIGAAIGAAIGLAVGLITDLVIYIVEEWDKISAWFKKVGKWFDKYVIQPIANFFKGLWKAIAGFFSNLWDDIKVIWSVVATWFNENVIQPLVNFFAPIVEWIAQFFRGCWLIIQAVWVVSATWFNENVITPIVEFFRGLWEAISGFFVNLWEGIKKVWNVVATWFNTWVIQPVVGFFKGVWTSVSEFFVNLWEGIKNVWGKVSTWFEDTITTPLSNVFKKVCDAIAGFFSKLWLGIRQGVAGAMNGVIGVIESALNWVISGINGLVGGFNKVVQWAANVLGADWGGLTLVQEVRFNRIAVPTYADGGFPESGQAFIARENGIPEMVGTIGRRTAVANNEQIVESVASGVAEANSEQNALLREQNSLLRALLEKDSGVYLDGRALSESVNKYRREQGRAIIAGGVL